MHWPRWRLAALTVLGGSRKAQRCISRSLFPTSTRSVFQGCMSGNSSIQPNRRMRTRMYGGAGGGGEATLPPIPIRHAGQGLGTERAEVLGLSPIHIGRQTKSHRSR